MRIHSFLLNFAQKRNKIIQQWTLENLFERLKATIIRNDFLRTIIIIGLIALACLIIYIEVFTTNYSSIFYKQ